MTSIRVGTSKGKKGVYKVAVFQVGKEKKFGIGYNIDKKLEASLLKTFDMLESCLIRGDDPDIALQQRILKLPERIRKKLEAHGLIGEIAGGPDLRSVADEFLAAKLTVLDPRSVRNYRSALEKGILRFVGERMLVEQLDADSIIGFVEKSTEEHKQSTVANQIKRSKALLQFAKEKGYIQESPFEAGRVRDKCSFFRIGLEKDRADTQVRFMTDEQIDKLLHCKKTNRSEIEEKEWNALIWMLRYGGARVSSYLVLRWRDIDFEGKTMLLRMKQTEKGKFQRGRKKEVIVPLFKELQEPLKQLREVSPDKEFVLNRIGNLESKPEFETFNAGGERILRGRWETNLSTTFKKILERNGLDVWSQPFHAFRGLRAEELARQEATEIQISKWIGNSLEVRKRFYSTQYMKGAEKFT